jgi:hypothetical protein
LIFRKADAFKKTLEGPVRPRPERGNAIDSIQIAVNGKDLWEWK